MWALGLGAAFAADAFDRPVALAGYVSGWEGSYGAGGVGGRLRIEPGERVGLDLFAEHYLVATPAGLRHDHPIGFSLYAPVDLGGPRLSPLAGMCVVGSFIESEEQDAPGADDVLFGAHAGLNLEAPANDRFSAFVQAKAIGWLGHDRAVQGWSGAVGSTLDLFAVAQLDVGLAVHLGRL